jgi:hypothetical protein
MATLLVSSFLFIHLHGGDISCISDVQDNCTLYYPLNRNCNAEPLPSPSAVFPLVGFSEHNRWSVPIRVTLMRN